MAYLVLVRHGESEWNKKGIWTGLTDIPLNEDGKKESISIIAPGIGAQKRPSLDLARGSSRQCMGG